MTKGTTAKNTTAIRSVEQAVEWNEKPGAFSPHPPSNLMLSLYVKHTFPKDILIGTCGVPLEPQRNVAVVLTKGEGSS